jgi:hypothetical protein
MIKIPAQLKKNNELRNDIDYYLNHGSKISAIKILREYFISIDEDQTLRESKDIIDLYEKRLIMSNKMEMLRDRIETWAERNGYDNIDLYKETKDKTGQYIWTYTDWEFVDDMYGNMINDYEWYPHHKVLQDMNKLWKKYSKFNQKYNMKNITSSFCDVDRITGI